jgi:hypothetical protein
MRLMTVLFLALAGFGGVPLPVLAAEAVALAEDFLMRQADVVSCDDQHSVYGVAYVDGSYMERVFYVEHPPGPLTLRVEVEGPEQWPTTVDGALPDALPPRPFVVEVTVPRALFAVPDGKAWIRTEMSWGKAFRFKYTHWYGEIARTDGQWQVEWKDYRRPMLPARLKAQSAVLCAWFADPESRVILPDVTERNEAAGQ